MKAPPPFSTSLLQQAGSTRLRFSASRTMRIAQSLYEGVELGEEGSVGLITYMRTDSYNVSDDAITAVREVITNAHGKEYLPATPNTFTQRKGAQLAHEAIRPTYLEQTPEGRAVPDRRPAEALQDDLGALPRLADGARAVRPDRREDPSGRYQFRRAAA